MLVRNGDALVLDVSGTTGEWLPRTVAGVRQSVLDNLSHFFDVEDVTMESDAFLSDPIHYVTNWPYTSRVSLTSQSDYADHRDVASVVAHAFYEATGDLPTVTVQGADAPQGNPDAKQGVSITTALVLVVVGLIAIAVIKFE